MKPENPYPRYGAKGQEFDVSTHVNRIKNQAWEEGFDAAVKWLNEPCKEHPCEEDKLFSVPFYPCHRYSCSQCRKKIGLDS